MAARCTLLGMEHISGRPRRPAQDVEATGSQFFLERYAHLSAAARIWLSRDLRPVGQSAEERTHRPEVAFAFGPLRGTLGTALVLINNKLPPCKAVAVGGPRGLSELAW